MTRYARQLTPAVAVDDDVVGHVHAVGLGVDPGSGSIRITIEVHYPGEPGRRYVALDAEDVAAIVDEADEHATALGRRPN